MKRAAKYISDLSNTAPALLEVLGCFREDDYERIHWLIADYEIQAKEAPPHSWPHVALDLLNRLAEAAAKMEAEQEKQR